MSGPYYCVNTYRALLHYAAQGLHPGSFGRALLIGDPVLAECTAHRALRPVRRGGTAETDIVANMVALVQQRFPPMMHGSVAVFDTWIGHRGFAQAPPETKALVMLFGAPDFIANLRAIVRRKNLVEPT